MDENPFSHSDKETGEEKEEIKAKMPDFVYIDDEHEETSSGRGGHSEFVHAFEKLEQADYPFFMRIVTFSAACMIALISVFVLLFLGLGLIASAVTFFQLPSPVRWLRGSWRVLCQFLVFILGFVIATFNPPFGLGIIFMYFMLQGENMNEGMVGRMFQSRFKL